MRSWLSIPEGVLARVCDLNTRVLEQARKELSAKASITFKPRPKRESRKTVGWFFEIRDNKPKRQKVVGAIELPESARQAQTQHLDAQMASAKAQWEQASKEQRQKWLDQMGIGSRMAPQNGAEPRAMLLSFLVRLLEPELPL